MSTKRILVVDDDASIRRLVATILRRERYAVDIAAGGKDAIAMIEQTRYDVVILDLMMPEVNGHMVLKTVGVCRPQSRCVIVMSAASHTEVATAVNASVFAVLAKPFDIAMLIAAVTACVNGSHKLQVA